MRQPLTKQTTLKLLLQLELLLMLLGLMLLGLMLALLVVDLQVVTQDSWGLKLPVQHLALRGLTKLASLVKGRDALRVLALQLQVAHTAVCRSGLPFLPRNSFPNGAALAEHHTEAALVGLRCLLLLAWR